MDGFLYYGVNCKVPIGFARAVVDCGREHVHTTGCTTRGRPRRPQ
jgi:hypothetical protein